MAIRVSPKTGHSTSLLIDIGTVFLATEWLESYPLFMNYLSLILLIANSVVNFSSHNHWKSGLSGDDSFFMFINILPNYSQHNRQLPSDEEMADLWDFSSLLLTLWPFIDLRCLVSFSKHLNDFLRVDLTQISSDVENSVCNSTGNEHFRVIHTWTLVSHQTIFPLPCIFKHYHRRTDLFAVTWSPNNITLTVQLVSLPHLILPQLTHS